MRSTLLCAVIFLGLSAALAQNLTVSSPDARLAVTVSVGEVLSLKAMDGTALLFRIDSLSLEIAGESPSPMRLLGSTRRSCDTTIVPPVREKYARVRDLFNELTVAFDGGRGMVLRAYNDGIAYRFTTRLPGTIVVRHERLSLLLSDSARVTYQFSKEFWSAYEYPYQTTGVDGVPPAGYCSLPVLASLRDGRKILFTEAQIEDYPGLWLQRSGGTRLVSTFPGYPLELLESADLYTRGKVTRHAEYIARTTGTRAFPWRVAIVARQDADLLRSSLVYLLGAPQRIDDVSWITPGVVTLDWWARRNLEGVDFVGGVNTATAKYLIDFAASYGIGYFLLDEGWTKDGDLLAINPELDITAVAAYARQKGIRLLLWAVWSTLERQWDAAFEQFSRLGAAGIKVDFMNRDDQEMVRFYYRVAAETARRTMLAIFHGAYKPDGLRRTYPNVITREGLIEFEQNQVNLSDSPEYHTILPFIRMVAGPADYLPGTVNNAQPDEFRMLTQRPMGQGTRAHSMALCVVLESPMRMLPDAPPDYYRADTCTRFMASIPVVWDDLRVLAAQCGEYVAVARRSGESWYVAAITNSTPRTLEIDCGFLDPAKTYAMTAFRDGANADRRGTDHRVVTGTLHATDRISLRLARGGGWVGKLTPAR